MFPATAVLWLRTSLGDACDISVCVGGTPSRVPPIPELPLAPDPIPGGGPPGPEGGPLGVARCARVGTADASAIVPARIRVKCFISSPVFCGGGRDRPGRPPPPQAPAGIF